MSFRNHFDEKIQVEKCPGVWYNLYWLFVWWGMKGKTANLTHHQMMKLANNKAITTNVLGNICKVLDYKVEDIMEFIEEERGIK